MRPLVPVDIDAFVVTFTRHTDDDHEWVTVDGEWPDVVFIDTRFLTQADPAYVRVDGDRVTISCANGEAIYRLSDFAIERLAYRAEAVARARWPVEEPPEWRDAQT